MAVTTPEQWLNDYEEVTLPSGKTVGVRQFDVISILTEDGEVPTVLRPVIDNMIMQTESGQQAEEMKMDSEAFASMGRLFDRLIDACWVAPKLVETREQVLAGEGITKDMIGFNDKVYLFSWAMGGEQQLNATTTFPEGQK